MTLNTNRLGFTIVETAEQFGKRNSTGPLELSASSIKLWTNSIPAQIVIMS